MKSDRRSRFRDFEPRQVEKLPEPNRGIQLKYSSEEAQEELWLVTYSDTITNLLCFFLLLIAVSKPDTDRVKEVKQAISKALKVKSETTATLLKENSEPLRKEREQTQQVESVKTELVAVAESTNLGEGVQVNVEHQSLVIVLDSGTFFQSGSADLLEESHGALRKVAEKLVTLKKKRKLEVQIEGHTDSQPIGELLAARTGIRDNW